MPTHFYWGNDEYRLVQAVVQLQAQVVDIPWTDFNYSKISATTDAQIIEGLTQAMTAPFGNGGRLTWMVESRIAKSCSDSVLLELERTLPFLPENSHLVFSSSEKPDARLKVTKLLQKYAQVQEFSLIPPWDTEALVKVVEEAAHRINLPLDRQGIAFLAEAIGNDTRRLQMELSKIQLWLGESTTPPTLHTLGLLVAQSAHNTLELGQNIRQGATDRALGLLQELLQNNEPGIRITTTLVGQFRTWLLIKVCLETGERDDKIIAQTADLGNPKRLYFLKKEIQALRSGQLLEALSLLLHLEVGLKRGSEEVATLQTAVIHLCSLFRSG